MKILQDYLGKFINNAELNALFTSEGLIDNSSSYSEVITTIVELLFENKEHIDATGGATLLSENFLKSEMDAIVGSTIPEIVVKNIFYTFKYFASDYFFKNNYQHFIPEYDYNLIVEGEQTKVFFENFMNMLDIFSEEIRKIYDLYDIDLIDDDFLNYYSEMFGFAREEDTLLTQSSFRELLKNIVPLYQKKGTHASVKLFMEILGFETKIEEKWFDKRKYLSNGTTDVIRNSFSSYLVDYPPELFHSDSTDPTLLAARNSSSTVYLSPLAFAGLCEAYGASKILGFEAGYTGSKYEYFKTNIVFITIKPFDSSYTWTTAKKEAIKRYLEFIIPTNVDFENYLTFS